MTTAPTLDVAAGRTRLSKANKIRTELLRDEDGLRRAFEGYKYFECDGKTGRRLSELRRNA